MARRVPGWECLQSGDLRGICPMGGGTNEGFAFETDAGRFVLRISGENARSLGINRDAEFAALASASAAGIAPHVVYFFQPEGHLLTRWFEGRTLTWDDMPAHEVLGRVADTLRRAHALPPTAYEFRPMEDIRQRLCRARELGLALPESTDRHVELAASLCARYWCLPEADRALCHADAYANNYMASEERLILIDWEFAGMGDLYYDLNAALTGCPPEAEDFFLTRCFGEVPADAKEKLWAIRYVSWVWNWTWAVLQLHFRHNSSEHVREEQGLFAAMESRLAQE